MIQKEFLNHEDFVGKVQILTPKETYTVDYPQAVKAAEEQESIIWFARELGVEKDVGDIRTQCTAGERHGITTTLKLFTNYECVDSETEVLTPTGWVNISEITTDNPIAQWNPENFEVSFVKPDRVFSKHYEGEMVYLHDTWRNVNQLVTPNHRIPFRTDKVGKYRFREAGEIKLHQGNYIPISGNKVGGRSCLTFLERFLISSQADGSYTLVDENNYRKKLGGYSIVFGFTKERKKQRLEWILGGLGWEYAKKERQQKGKSPVTEYRVIVPYSEVESSKSFKSFKEWIDLGEVDSQWCREFIEELAEWDGSKISGRGVVDYRTTSKENADTVQTLVAVSGSLGTIRVQKDVRSETFNDIYYIQIRKQVEKSGQHLKKELVPYSGMVYCPTVPTGAFLMRRGDVVSVTGNCLLGGDEFWGGKIGKMFPRPDIQRMAATFTYIELGVHAPFYSLINESLNIATDEFYLSWKEVPELVSRMEFVDHFANSKDPLLTTAAFTFLEGVVLFSNFAFLKSFGSGGFNLIPHITAGIDASAKDEHYHAMASAWLYNQTKKEMVEAGVLTESDINRYVEVIYQIADQVYEHEKAIADIIFEQGGIRTVTKENILHFVRNRIDVMLEMLEIPPLFGEERGVVSEWFYNQLSSYKYSDFFHAQQIQYVRTWAKHQLTFRPYMAGEV